MRIVPIVGSIFFFLTYRIHYIAIYPAGDENTHIKNIVWKIWKFSRDVAAIGTKALKYIPFIKRYLL